MNSKLSTNNLLHRPPLRRRLLQNLLGRGLKRKQIVKHAQCQIEPKLVSDIRSSVNPADVTADMDVPVCPSDVTEIQMLTAAPVMGTRWSSGTQALEKMWKGSKYSGAEISQDKDLSRDKVAKLFASDGLDALLPILSGDLFSRTYGPLTLPYSLYHFQREGIDFLLDRDTGALLADDMGLGKTVQSIVALSLLLYHEKAHRALIVAPKSVLVSWEKHFSEWAPELRTKSMMGSPIERDRRWHELTVGRFSVGIITYDSLRIDSDRLILPTLDLVIADEVQMIKNPGTKRSQALHQLPVKRRWALTGTPLENNESEFRSILHFVDPEVQIAGDPQGYFSFGQSLESVTKRLMLRRKKEQVLEQLPKLKQDKEYIRLGRVQRKVYQRAERDGISELRSKPRSITSILQLINELKQICNGVVTATGRLDSPKLEWLLDYLEIAKQEGDKTLVYSQYTNVLPDKMKAHFPLKYQGDMSDSERERVIEEFSNSTEHYAMLMSLRAGGMGINLQAANRVVHFDSWWNPAVSMQATARAHRLKQKKKVFEITLVTINTIEEKIEALLKEKRDLFDRLVDDHSVPGSERPLTLDEMYSLFDLD